MNTKRKITREQWDRSLAAIESAILSAASKQAEAEVRARNREQGVIYVREYTVPTYTVAARLREARPQPRPATRKRRHLRVVR